MALARPPRANAAQRCARSSRVPAGPPSRLTFDFRLTLPTSGKKSPPHPQLRLASTRPPGRVAPCAPASRVPMRPSTAAAQRPAPGPEPRRLPGWAARRSFPRTVRRGGRCGAATYPSAGPPPRGPGAPPRGPRSPPCASDCFGSNGNGASRPGSRRLFGVCGPPRPFVVVLLPLAPATAPARACPLGVRASPPRSGVSSARPAPGCPRPACEPVYGPLTMSLKPQPPAPASGRKPGGGLLSSPGAAPASAASSSSSAVPAPAAPVASSSAAAGVGRPGLGRWVSAPQPPPRPPGGSRAARPLPRLAP